MRKRTFAATFLAAMLAAAPCFADTVTGLWRGEYVCGQGLTALNLSMREDERGRVTATFAFSEHPKNPGVPTGCFTLAGRYNARTGALALKQERWIKQPDPFWYMIDFGGTVSKDGAHYSGKVIFPEDGLCTTFTVARISRAAPPAGAAACDGADLVS